MLIRNGISPALGLFIFLIVTPHFSARTQLVIHSPDQPSVSLRPYAQILQGAPGNPAYFSGESGDAFMDLKEMDENIGFSDEDFWVRCTITNETNRYLNYYLEIARPITDYATLYVKDQENLVSTQKSGDAIAFADKSIAHRKSLFHLGIKANETIQLLIHLKSDGEVLKIPMKLITPGDFLYQTYREQLFYGFFYGILILACVIYLFFYSAMRDTAFIYYGLYVFFIAMLEFSLDGLFHQYILADGGWISNRAVLGFALVSLFCFGRYGRSYLELRTHHQKLDTSFRIISWIILMSLGCLFFIPAFLKFCYPLANIIGLVVLLQMIGAIVMLKRKNIPVDNYFMAGITFLVMGFAIFILNNLEAVPNSFFTDNGAKFGIGLEIICLSLSMSNRIRLLRKQNEDNQLLALQRSEDMNEIKSSFISNISHELRTPLNLNMGVAGSLCDDKSDQDLRDKCKLILGSSENLLGNIEDILDFTVIEKGNLELQEIPFDLDCVLNKVTRTNQEKATNKKLHFDFSCEPGIPKKIIGDKLKLLQILNNLMDNAVKFTTSGSIAFHVGYKLMKEGQVCYTFNIRDTGIGITREKAATIFESFTKKSFMDKREFYGLGLGLFIVKNYVELQGGRISFKDNQLQGTVCCVELEYHLDPEEVYETTFPAVTGTLQPMQPCDILLVEDNKMNQKVIALLVKKWNTVTLTIANNGQEALDLIRQRTFDLVLMDLQMPVMDGFEATAAIKSGKLGVAAASTPIIVLTADSTHRTKKEVMRLGANDYLTKPLKGDLLYARIQKQLIPVQKASPATSLFSAGSMLRGPWLF